MSAAFVRSRVSKSVGWRLAAGVSPSVLTVGLVVGLFYYGEIGRAAPRVILVLASALTVVSLAIAWANARYFADRLARLARVTNPASGDGERADEFDRIEQAVGNMGSALSAAEAERARTDAVGAARLRDHATMLAGVVGDALSQLDEIRLPLHILLESRFGELNENQEELLRDARTAADAIDVALRRLGQLADADRGAMSVQRELVQINDVVRSVIPLARASTERQSARMEVTLEPGLPRVIADRARLAEALALLMSDGADESNSQTPLVISTERAGAAAIIRIKPVGKRKESLIVASSLVTAQGGEVVTGDDGLTVRIGGTSTR